MKMFKRLRHRQVTPPPLPVVQYPNPVLLWNEISSAIGSAAIHIRGGDDLPAIVDMPGYVGFKCEKGEARKFFTNNFPGITDDLIERALRYLNSHVISAARRANARAEELARFDSPRKRWSVSEW